MKETSPPEEDEVICKCFQVTERTIRDCIAKNNITEVEEVTKACEAGGNCQSCHILIQLFIDQNQATKNPPAHTTDTGGKKTGFFSRLFAKS